MTGSPPRRVIMPRDFGMAGPRPKMILSVHGYLRKVRMQKAILHGLEEQRSQLERIVYMLSVILKDNTFRALIYDEGFEAMPRHLAARIDSQSGLVPRPARRTRSHRPKLSPTSIVLLKNTPIRIGTFGVLERMAPKLQIHTVRRMIAAKCFLPSFALCELDRASGVEHSNLDGPKPRYTADQHVLMKGEGVRLQDKVSAFKDIARDSVDFVFAKGYAARLYANPQVRGYIAKHQRSAARVLGEVFA